MQKVFALFMAVGLVGCIGTGRLGPEARRQSGADSDALVLSKAAPVQIVLPDEHRNAGVEPFLRQTAMALQKSLHAVTGAEVPIVPEGQRRPGPALYLGMTRAALAAGLRVDRTVDYGGLIAERSGDLFVLGRDEDRFGRDKVSRNRNDYLLGTVKAAVVFMEDYLGTRFLLPGEIGTEYGAAAPAPVPRQLTREVVPPLVFATGRHYGLLYDYANNNYGSGRFRSYGGHSYYAAVPNDKYAKEHPEYFAFLGGARTAKDNHLCISNHDVQELIYAEVLRQLDAGAEVVQLAQTDGYQPCECPQCQTLGQTDDPGEKLWIIHRAMAERLLKDRPGKKVHIISYGPTKYPPRSFRSFPENVVIELCSYTQEMFDLWSEVNVPGGFTVYIYNWGWYQLVGLTPKTSPDACAEQIRLFLRNDVKGIYRCGFGELFGLEGPCYYVYGKTMDDSDKNTEQVLTDYYRAAFQTAAAPMSTFYAALYDRVETLYVRQGMYSFLAEGRGLPGNPRIVLGAIYTPDLIEVMEKNLSRAEALADLDRVKARLGLVRQEFDYVKSLATVIAFYNSFRFKPDQGNFAQLAEAVEARNAMIDGFYTPRGDMKSLPGWPEIAFLGRAPKDTLLLNGRLRAPLSAPFTWNVARLREQNIIPGISNRTMTVSPAGAPIEGLRLDFESGAWKSLPWQNLQGIQLGETRAKTRFKVTYDQDHLFFAFVSTVEPGRDYETLGHDGPAWRQDCLELTLDPLGQRQQYYHFVFNPVPDSFYEAAFGLVKDTLDPRYGKSDASWNGEWSYRGEIRDGVWTALVAIPFATLGATRPERGARWTMNIGREDYRLNAKGKHHVELSLWSPNLETMSFHDREAFGELVFD
jgi:hypothetical protein